MNIVDDILSEIGHLPVVDCRIRDVILYLIEGWLRVIYKPLVWMLMGWIFLP